MKLVDLEPQFLKVIDADSHCYVDTILEAQGLLFLCPLCFINNNGPIGTHSILTWFRDRGVPDDQIPIPGRWIMSGSDYSNLNLYPSIQLTLGCKWHGNIINGNIQIL
jgi:hypothetical protein